MYLLVVLAKFQQTLHTKQNSNARVLKQHTWSERLWMTAGLVDDSWGKSFASGKTITEGLTVMRWHNQIEIVPLADSIVICVTVKATYATWCFFFILSFSSLYIKDKRYFAFPAPHQIIVWSWFYAFSHCLI